MADDAKDKDKGGDKGDKKKDEKKEANWGKLWMAIIAIALIPILIAMALDAIGPSLARFSVNIQMAKQGLFVFALAVTAIMGAIALGLLFLNKSGKKE